VLLYGICERPWWHSFVAEDIRTYAHILESGVEILSHRLEISQVFNMNWSAGSAKRKKEGKGRVYIHYYPGELQITCDRLTIGAPLGLATREW
jgi:hypothetical protein